MLLNDLILEAKLPEKLKHGSTRGHLGEFLLGGAIVAKFIKGESAIDASDVKQVLVKNAAGDLSSTHQGESANDVINFVNVISNPKNIADAKEVDFTLNVMSEELVGVIKFANSVGSLASSSNITLVEFSNAVVVLVSRSICVDLQLIKHNKTLIDI